MKNEGKLLLAAFGRFCAYCLLAALPVFVLRQDLLGAGNTLGERSLVELTQEHPYGALFVRLAGKH